MEKEFPLLIKPCEKNMIIYFIAAGEPRSRHNLISADTFLRKRANQLSNFLIFCTYENENVTDFRIHKNHPWLRV